MAKLKLLGADEPDDTAPVEDSPPDEGEDYTRREAVPVDGNAPAPIDASSAVDPGASDDHAQPAPGFTLDQQQEIEQAALRREPFPNPGRKAITDEEILKCQDAFNPVKLWIFCCDVFRAHMNNIPYDSVEQFPDKWKQFDHDLFFAGDKLAVDHYPRVTISNFIWYLRHKAPVGISLQNFTGHPAIKDTISYLRSYELTCARMGLHEALAPTQQSPSVSVQRVQKANMDPTMPILAAIVGGLIGRAIGGSKK